MPRGLNLLAHKSKMSIEIIMPKTGLTNTENTLGSWSVSEGEMVKKGQVLAEIESEKTTMPLESLDEGIIHMIAQEGETIKVGGVIGILAKDQAEYQKIREMKEPKEKPEEKAAPAEEKHTLKSEVPHEAALSLPGQRIIASPLAKKKARDKGIDLSLVIGTGPGGRIVARDIEQFTPVSAGAAASAARGEPVRIPLTGIRKAIAKNMYESLRSMAQTSDSVEVDVTELVNIRKKLVEKTEELGTKITLNDLLSYATVKMLKSHPLANAAFGDREIITYPYVHLSVAVATDYGLTSPVIRDADLMSVVQLSRALKTMITKARDNKLTPDDLTGGTFTLTNMGIFPVDNFNPIVNPPQSAIIGFGRCVDKPVVYRGEIAIRTMMFLSITYDHRVFDGGEVGSILKTMKDYLENPELFLVQ